MPELKEKYGSPRDRALAAIASERPATQRRIGGAVECTTGRFELLNTARVDAAKLLGRGVNPVELDGVFILSEDLSGTVYVSVFDKWWHAEDEFEHLERKFFRWVLNESDCEKCLLDVGRHGGNCADLREVKAPHIEAARAWKIESEKSEEDN